MAFRGLSERVSWWKSPSSVAFLALLTLLTACRSPESRQGIWDGSGASGGPKTVDSRGAALGPLGDSITVDTLPGGAIRTSSSGPMEWSGTSGWRFQLERTAPSFDFFADPPGQITGIALLPDGRVVLNERKPTRIRLYTPGDSTLKLIARNGEGPGEVMSPYIDMVGDTLTVRDEGLRRITFYSLAGDVFFSTPIPPANSTTAGPVQLLTGGKFALRFVVPIVGGPRQVGAFREVRPAWRRIARDGSVVDTILGPEPLKQTNWSSTRPDGSMGVQYSVPLIPETVATLLPDGMVLYGRTDRNEFVVTRNGRDTVRIIRRTGTIPTTISSATKDSIMEQYNKWIPGVPNREDLPKTWPFWAGLRSASDGDLWVGLESEPGRFGSHYAIYAADGHYRGEVAAPFSRGIKSWSGDRIAVIDSDENDMPRLRIYRLDRRTGGIEPR